MQALGQLAGGIAHDFNNVLQAMMGALTLIERRGDDRAAVARLVRLAGEAGERGASITRRLLGFARRAELRAEPVDIAGLLASLSEILRHTLGAGITIEVVAAEGLQPAFVDRGQLETVVINLATNARDAMPTGGHLRLVAEAASVPMDEPPDGVGLEPGDYVRLTVADTGAGMDAATLARAVEPFFTTKGPGEGTGLGLSMAKGMAEQSGGALGITSARGKGTRVTMWLPVADPATAVRDDMTGPGVGQSALTSRARRLLLVDDQQHVRDVLSAQFRDAGFDVVVAASGQEAIALLHTHSDFDALVTDLSMPETDGLAVIKAAHARFPRLPAILLTGYAGDDAALALTGAIAGEFVLLRKPVHEGQLIERLRAMLAEPVSAG
jgi:CheY-like chemotaxis protein